MSKEELHSQVDTWDSKWLMVCLVHTMIDMEMITELKCQRPECLYDYAAFDFSYENAANDRRGNPLGPCLDHIIPQHKGGLHRIENLRLAHIGCNAGWRRGLTGLQPHSPETRQKLSESVARAHREGKMKKIYTPERDAKIRATMIEKGLWKA